MSGILRLEFEGEAEPLDAHAGDFVHVPAFTVHRESNPGREPSLAVIARAGGGIPTVNVDAAPPARTSDPAAERSTAARMSRVTTFDGENLEDARFTDSNLDGAEFREVTMVGARIIGSVLIDVEIDAYVKNLTVNGVDVVPLVEAELDRLHPERVALRPTDIAGAIAALDVVDAFWEPTLARVRACPRS